MHRRVRSEEGLKNEKWAPRREREWEWEKECTGGGDEERKPGSAAVICMRAVINWIPACHFTQTKAREQCHQTNMFIHMCRGGPWGNRQREWENHHGDAEDGEESERESVSNGKSHTWDNNASVWNETGALDRYKKKKKKLLKCWHWGHANVLCWVLIWAKFGHSVMAKAKAKRNWLNKTGWTSGRGVKKRTAPSIGMYCDSLVLCHCL